MWTQTQVDRGQIVAARFNIDSGWEPPVLMGAIGSAQSLDVAMDATGNAIAVWDKSSTANVFASRFAVGSGWETPRALGLVGAGARSPRLQMDANGGALATFFQTFNGQTQLRTSRFDPAAGWNVIGDIASERDDIAGDAGGNAIAVWREGSAPNSRIVARHYEAGQGWGSSTVIADASDPSGLVRDTKIAVNTNGDAVAVWLDLVSSSGDRDLVVSNFTLCPRTVAAGVTQSSVRPIPGPGMAKRHDSNGTRVDYAWAHTGVHGP